MCFNELTLNPFKIQRSGFAVFRNFHVEGHLNSCLHLQNQDMTHHTCFIIKGVPLIKEAKMQRKIDLPLSRQLTKQELGKQQQQQVTN